VSAVLLASLLALIPARAHAAGRQLWADRFTPGDTPADVAVSPDGTTVFVTGCGASGNLCSLADFETAAFRVATGELLWTATFDDPKGSSDVTAALAVSPDGARVFVTGQTPAGSSSYQDIVTIAYDAVTGAQEWISDFGESQGNDWPTDLAVSPDGTKVVVTGFTAVVEGGGFATIAYDARTGAQDWLATYVGPFGWSGAANALVFSPDGSRTFVTGAGGGLSYYDFATIAYDTSTGTQRWVARFNDEANGGDTAYAIGVTPDGSKVFVTGCAGIAVLVCEEADYATIGYDAMTGTQLWLQTFNDQVDGHDVPSDLGVSPDGTRVYVTGTSDTATRSDFVTIAYDASTGTQQWLEAYAGAGNRTDQACCLEVGPADKVIVTGRGYLDGFNDTRYETVAYAGLTGSKQWVVYNRLPSLGDVEGLSLTPNGELAFIAGYRSTGSAYDWEVIAYRT
jgi:DNA-binding beta-propeller fold protein YncE